MQETPRCLINISINTWEVGVSGYVSTLGFSVDIGEVESKGMCGDVTMILWVQFIL